MPARPHVSVFIATSLDGFIAREDGTLDWLPVPQPGGEDYGYGDFIASIDALVMGRKTFDSVQAFETWYYGDLRVVVLSRGAVSVPDALRATVEVSGLAPADLLTRLAAEGVARVYLDGGETIRGFLRAGLVDEFIVTRVPVLLGQGRPLFGPLDADVPLAHVETRAFPDGLVQSRYQVRSGAAS